MTPAQVSAALYLHPKTVTRYALEGRLRSVQLPGGITPGHRRYFRAEIDALIAGKPLTGEQLDALVRGEAW
jgi:hypothetical protein